MKHTLYRDNIKADTFYCFDDEPGYAYSPDGVGMYWYDTIEEVTDQFGEVTNFKHYDNFKEF